MKIVEKLEKLTLTMADKHKASHYPNLLNVEFL